MFQIKSHCEMNEVREEDESDDGGGDLSGVVPPLNC